MKSIRKLLLITSMVVLAPGLAFAEGVDAGKTEFMSNCAVCHGVNGSAGPYLDFLKVAPPDVTMLSKNNGGVFPFQYVYEVIDGRADVKAHGPRDMPVWGSEYNEKAAEYYSDYFKAYDSEAFIRSRIFALIEYINSIQK